MCKVIKYLECDGYEDVLEGSNIAFGEKDDYVIGGSKNGKIYIWSLETGKVVKCLEGGHQSAITAISYNVLSTFLYSADVDGNICHWS